MRCNYPDCDGGHATGYCHTDCRIVRCEYCGTEGRITYDQWKCDSGYDERDECHHEEFEIGWDGRAHCDRCSESWWASSNEIEAQRAHEEEYARWSQKEERREFWRELTYPFRWPVYLVLNRLWPRKSCSVLRDDEIPF